MHRGIFVLGLLFLVHCGRQQVTVPTELSGGLKAGDLLLEYQPAGQYLRLMDVRQNRVVLRLPLAPGFLSARVATDAVRERLASYKMHEVVREHCELQRISAGEASTAAINLAAELSCSGTRAAIEISFTQAADHVALKIRPRDARFNRLLFSFMAEEGERVFGGGEQFTHLDLRGRRIPMLSEEQGIGRGAQPITIGANLTAGAGGRDVTTYAPVPFFMTSAFRSFETSQTAYQLWDFKSDHYCVEIWDNYLELRFSTAFAYGELMKRYTARSGRMQPLPEWASGTILGVQGGKDKVEQVLNAALKAGNPVTAIWIQDWVGRRLTGFGSQLWWRWLPDETAYPNFRAWVQQLRARGVRVLGYINPFLADEGPIFAEAKAKGYLVRKRDGELYKIQTAGFPAYLVDLSNAEARTFLKNIIRNNLIGNGLAGYMADFGEWLPWDAQLASGESAAHWHNRYPVEWARLNREAIREAGLEREVVFFTRAGFAGSAEHSTLFWLGDQMVSFDEYDGLASAVTGLLTGGISGITLNHSDIGGYTTINNPVKNYHRSRELFLRWAEFAVFTPFFRTHEGNRPEKNYQAYSDEKIVAEFAALGRQHLALKPYFAQLMAEAAKSGMPLARPVFLHYPAEQETYLLRHQFLLGRDLMVAPVIEPAATSGRVYLPADTWIESSTGKKVTGPQWHTFAAPLGQPVAFIREGAAQRELLLQALR
ncbi:MAG TPA: alpha-glucosidase [Turneriella sp.]|nr:alpha-glucosidase [Turneriella sp.]